MHFFPECSLLLSLINGHVRLFFLRNKFHPTRWFSCYRLKIPSYPSVLRVGWIFHPYSFIKAYRFIREVWMYNIKLQFAISRENNGAHAPEVNKLNRNWNSFESCQNTHWGGQTMEICINLKRTNILWKCLD